MAKLYAWTNFSVPDKDQPHNAAKATKVVVGEEVSAEKLGLSDDEFQAYIDNGAVRPHEHPEMGSFQGSPVELAKAQMAAQAEGGFFDTQYGTVAVGTPPAVDPETGDAIPENETADEKRKRLFG